MRILITGNQGFIGRNFEKKLKALGHDICGVDIKACIDCRDFFKTSNEVFDLVVHCAAIVGGRVNIEQSPISVATDLSIDAEMFNWAVRTGQKAVVYFSSSAAYPIEYQNRLMFDDLALSGNPAYPKILKESDIDLKNIKEPDQTYGWAKITGEMLAQKAREKGVKVYVFRPFSGYGEDQDLDYPFPSFIKRVKDGVDEFEIWGDGEQVRDFIHIDDIFDTVMAVIKADYQEPVNIATGRATSFNQLFDLVCSGLDKKPKIKYLLSSPKGVKYRVGNIEIMSKFHSPKISIEEGIKRALNA
jgi:nucleoside-diphosphate-sugar epimerase